MDLEDLAIALLVVSFLTWTKQHAATWVAKVAGASLAPVVAVTVDRGLLLADGASIPFNEPRTWPRKGLGRSRIACVVQGTLRVNDGPKLVDILITQDGDAYYAPSSPPQRRTWRMNEE